jgi:excisionase family DNA binding protein
MEDVRVASFSWRTNARYRQDGGTMALSTLLCAWDCQFLVIATKSERPQKYKLVKERFYLQAIETRNLRHGVCVDRKSTRRRRASTAKEGKRAMMKNDSSHVLTVKELSDYLKVHPSTIYRQLKRGKLPAFKVGSDWRFNIESIDRWRLEQDAFRGASI